ncbi:AAA-ATPase-like protein, partial [Candidatus Magnetomorum sp. HK-1]
KGQIAPLRSYIEKEIFPTFHWRDNRWVNELTIKTIFMCLLMDDTNFLMISERQSRSGYADLAMIVRSDRRIFKLIDSLIEFKFIKAKSLKIDKKIIKKMTDTALFKLDPVKTKLNEARTQARKYSKELMEEFGDIVKLHTYAIISIGFERLLYKKL